MTESIATTRSDKQADYRIAQPQDATDSLSSQSTVCDL